MKIESQSLRNTERNWYHEWESLRETESRFNPRYIRHDLNWNMKSESFLIYSRMHNKLKALRNRYNNHFVRVGDKDKSWCHRCGKALIVVISRELLSENSLKSIIDISFPDSVPDPSQLQHSYRSRYRFWWQWRLNPSFLSLPSLPALMSSPSNSRQRRLAFCVRVWLFCQFLCQTK